MGGGGTFQLKLIPFSPCKGEGGRKRRLRPLIENCRPPPTTPWKKEEKSWGRFFSRLLPKEGNEGGEKDDGRKEGRKEGRGLTSTEFICPENEPSSPRLYAKGGTGRGEISIFFAPPPSLSLSLTSAPIQDASKKLHTIGR